MPPPTSMTMQLVLVVAFLTLNTAFNLYNKWMFTPEEKDGAGLSIPLMATVFHSLAGFVTAFVLSFFPNIYTPVKITGLKRWLDVLCISLFFGSTIGLNNTSLMHLPISIQQTIRACSPVVLAICAFLIENKRFTMLQIAALFTLVGGIVLTVLSNASASPLGIVLAMLSVVSGGLYLTFISLHLGPSGNLNVLDILYYTTVPVVVVLMPISFLTNEHEALEKFSDLNGPGEAILLILIGCVFAVTYNVMTFTFITMLSAVYLSVVANFKLVLLVVFGIVVFGESVGVVNVIGLCIATLGFAAYSVLEYQAKMDQQREKEKEKEKENGGKEKDVGKAV